MFCHVTDNKAYATSTCRGGYDEGATFREIKIAENCGEVPVYNESESTDILRNLSQVLKPISKLMI
jgi:hypothetical protein